MALDLDETTLNSHARLADRTREALHAVHDLGVPLVIATSRPERVLVALVGNDILEITSLVQMNGTIATGQAGLEGSVKRHMDLADARMCWDLTIQQAPWARMTVETDGILFAVNHHDNVDELWAFNTATPTMLVSFEEALRIGPAKISVNGLDGSVEALADEPGGMNSMSPRPSRCSAPCRSMIVRESTRWETR